MSYVLEDRRESKRLEEQADISQYSILKELKFFTLSEGESVLDLGCGTGLLSREIKSKFSFAEVSACDFSHERINVAKKNSQNINFFVQNIEDIRLHDQYDKVVSRYVFEHLQDPQRGMDNAYKLCKEGGEAYIIDFDGMFLNLYTIDDEFNSLLEEIQRGLNFDLFIGRKLPAMMKKSGFKNVKWDVEVSSFKGNELLAEIDNCKQRCENSFPIYSKILGEERAIKFSKKYIEYLPHEETVLFYNKFIVRGKK